MPAYVFILVHEAKVVIKDLLLMKYPVFIQLRFMGRKKHDWSNCVPGRKPRTTLWWGFWDQVPCHRMAFWGRTTLGFVQK